MIQEDLFRPTLAKHRPEWRGLFAVREVGKVRKARKVIVIEERRAA